jgi:hypothetical protein
VGTSDVGHMGRVAVVMQNINQATMQNLAGTR